MSAFLARPPSPPLLHPGSASPAAPGLVPVTCGQQTRAACPGREPPARNCLCLWTHHALWAATGTRGHGLETTAPRPLTAAIRLPPLLETIPQHLRCLGKEHAPGHTWLYGAVLWLIKMLLSYFSKAGFLTPFISVQGGVGSSLLLSGWM